MDDEPLNPVLASYLVRITVRAQRDIGVVPITIRDVESRIEGILIDAWGDGGVTINAEAERVDR